MLNCNYLLMTFSHIKRQHTSVSKNIELPSGRKTCGRGRKSCKKVLILVGRYINVIIIEILFENIRDP